MASLLTATESLPVISGGTELGFKVNTDNHFSHLVNGGGMSFLPGNVKVTYGGVNFQPVKRQITQVTSMKWRFIRWVDTYESEKNIFKANYIREAYRASYYNRTTGKYQHPWNRSWDDSESGASISTGHIIEDTDKNHQVEFDLTNSFDGVALKDFVKLPRFDLGFYHYSAKDNTVYLYKMYLDVTYTYDPDAPMFSSVSITPNSCKVRDSVIVSASIITNADIT